MVADNPIEKSSSSASLHSEASSGGSRLKLDKEHMSKYIEGKKLQKNATDEFTQAGMRHVESSDVLINMDKVELKSRSAVEKEKDDRSCGQKTKQFIVEDYYVPKNEILRQIISGILAALAVVPESIAFALVVGVAPQIGIDTTIVTSLLVGIVGARPGLVNGASGAIAVVIVTIVKDYGEAYMGYTVILAGIIASVFALLRLSTLVCLISAPVMVGFVNGLGIIMCLAQVNNFKANPGIAAPDPTPMPAPARHLLANYDVFTDGEPWVEPEIFGWMFLELSLVMASMVLFPFIPWKWTKNIPGSLIGIFLATGAEWGIVRPLGFSTMTIGDIGRMSGDFPRPLWMRDYDLPPFNMETLGIILPTAIALAMVALIEQLMTVEVVNEMTKTKSNSHREAFGLGVANIVAGLLGGMGGNAMIAHSILQVSAGGKYRMANIIVGCSVLIISVAAFPFVNLIPIAAFVGMIWMMVYHMIAWRSFMVMCNSCMSLSTRTRRGMHNKIKRTDALIIVIVTVVTVFTNLAVAVACGVLVNVVIFVLDSKASLTLTSKEDIDAVNPSNGEKHVTRIYDISGPLFFGSARQFVAFFTVEEDPQEVELHCQDLMIMDYSALDAIAKVASEYKENDKNFHLRFLTEEDHRTLTKAKGLMSDVASWRVQNIDEEGIDVTELPEDVATFRSNKYDFHVTMDETWMFRQAKGNKGMRQHHQSNLKPNEETEPNQSLAMQRIDSGKPFENGQSSHSK